MTRRIHAPESWSLARPVDPKQRPLESSVIAAVREAAAKRTDVVLWRNNTGVLEDRNGSRVAYGLAVGGADLVGLVTLDPRTVKGIARFFAWEGKRDHKEKPTDDQLAWGRIVRDMGGYWDWGWSVEQAMRAIDAAARGERGGPR